jgi:hypothetical protein
VGQNCRYSPWMTRNEENSRSDAWAKWDKAP